MRSFVVCVILATHLAVLCQAKLTSVTGQGIIISQPPSNVFNIPETVNGIVVNDDESSFVNGALAITGFNERQAVILSAPLQVSDDPVSILQPGIPYDSHFIFFHQSTPKTTTQIADATFFVDNRFVACTQSQADNGDYEIATDPYFGLSSVLYPQDTYQNRGYEHGDSVLGGGTAFIVHNLITQPGDYTRCFSASCVDSTGNSTCVCTPSFAGLCLSPNNGQYHCFDNATELVNSGAFNFADTCLVTAASVQATVQTCDSRNGCVYQSGNSGPFCLLSSSVASSVDLHITAGCGCDTVVTATFTAQPNGTDGCFPATTNIGPPPPPPPTCGDDSNCQGKTINPLCVSSTLSSSTNCATLGFDAAAPVGLC